MEKKDITIDTIAQDPPERPKLMSEEEKNNVLLEFEEEIKKLENRKKDLIFKLQDLTKKVKGKRKPDEVKEAELRKRTLVDSKRNLLDEIRSLGRQSDEIRQAISGMDDQKPDKFKKTKMLPQDENELD